MAVGSSPTFQRILPRRATHHPLYSSHLSLSVLDYPSGEPHRCRPGLSSLTARCERPHHLCSCPAVLLEFFLCTALDKGNHFLIRILEPRKPLFTACVTSYWSFLATPLFDIIGLIFLHPFGVRVLLACVFRCFKPYRMLSVLLGPIFSIYLASNILLCLSIVCQIQLPGQPSRHLPHRPSLRPTSQSSREKASLRFFHRSIITLFLPTSCSLLSTWVSRSSQFCHTLFQLPTATHSIPKLRISISTRLSFSPLIRASFKNLPQAAIQDASLQLFQAAPCASPERGEGRGQPSPAQGEEEALNPDCKTSPSSCPFLCRRLKMVLTARQSEPFGFRHVTTNIKGLSDEEYVSPSDCVPSCQEPHRRRTG